MSMSLYTLAARPNGSVLAWALLVLEVVRSAVGFPIGCRCIGLLHPGE